MNKSYRNLISIHTYEMGRLTTHYSAHFLNIYFRANLECNISTKGSEACAHGICLINKFYKKIIRILAEFVRIYNNFIRIFSWLFLIKFA